jgi:hypothetical protein
VSVPVDTGLAPARLAAIAARSEAATSGPWGWRGYANGSIELRALHSGGLRVVTTMRAQPCVVELDDGAIALTSDACDTCRAEMKKTTDPFVDWPGCPKEENLDTLWLRGGPGVRPANVWAEREVPYREDIVGVRHPDAEFIAHAREDVPALIAEVERLRSMRATP